MQTVLLFSNVDTSRQDVHVTPPDPLQPPSVEDQPDILSSVIIFNLLLISYHVISFHIFLMFFLHTHVHTVYIKIELKNASWAMNRQLRCHKMTTGARAKLHGFLTESRQDAFCPISHQISLRCVFSLPNMFSLKSALNTIRFDGSQWSRNCPW